MRMRRNARVVAAADPASSAAPSTISRLWPAPGCDAPPAPVAGAPDGSTELVTAGIGAAEPVGVPVGVGVGDTVAVPVGVGVGDPVAVSVGVGVGDTVEVPVGVGVGDPVEVPVGVGVGDPVGLPVGVGVGVGVDPLFVALIVKVLADGS
jgi:hypothetical protein